MDFDAFLDGFLTDDYGRKSVAVTPDEEQTADRAFAAGASKRVTPLDQFQEGEEYRLGRPLKPTELARAEAFHRAGINQGVDEQGAEGGQRAFLPQSGVGRTLSMPLLNTAFDAATLAARVIPGLDGDDLQRTKARVNQEVDEMDQEQGTSGISKHMRGAGESLLKMYLLRGAGANELGMAAGFGLDQANQSYSSGREAGLDGWKLLAHAGAQGALEGGIQYAFGRLGHGGVESRVLGSQTAKSLLANPQTMRQVVVDALTKAAKTTAEEIPEEVLTSVLQEYANRIATGEENDMEEILKDTIIQTVLMGGMGEAVVRGGKEMDYAREIFRNPTDSAGGYVNAVRNNPSGLEAGGYEAALPDAAQLDDPNFIDGLDDYINGISRQGVENISQGEIDADLGADDPISGRVGRGEAGAPQDPGSLLHSAASQLGAEDVLREGVFQQEIPQGERPAAVDKLQQLYAERMAQEPKPEVQVAEKTQSVSDAWAEGERDPENLFKGWSRTDFTTLRAWREDRPELVTEELWSAAQKAWDQREEANGEKRDKRKQANLARSQAFAADRPAKFNDIISRMRIPKDRRDAVVKQAQENVASGRYTIGQVGATKLVQRALREAWKEMQESESEHRDLLDAAQRVEAAGGKFKTDVAEENETNPAEDSIPGPTPSQEGVSSEKSLAEKTEAEVEADVMAALEAAVAGDDAPEPATPQHTMERHETAESDSPLPAALEKGQRALPAPAPASARHTEFAERHAESFSTAVSDMRIPKERRAEVVKQAQKNVASGRYKLGKTGAYKLIHRAVREAWNEMQFREMAQSAQEKHENSQKTLKKDAGPTPSQEGVSSEKSLAEKTEAEVEADVMAALEAAVAGDDAPEPATPQHTMERHETAESDSPLPAALEKAETVDDVAEAIEDAVPEADHTPAAPPTPGEKVVPLGDKRLKGIGPRVKQWVVDRLTSAAQVFADESMEANDLFKEWAEASPSRKESFAKRMDNLSDNADLTMPQVQDNDTIEAMVAHQVKTSFNKDEAEIRAEIEGDNRAARNKITAMEKSGDLITFTIPGDGTFRVVNKPSAILSVLAKFSSVPAADFTGVRSFTVDEYQEVMATSMVKKKAPVAKLDKRLWGRVKGTAKIANIRSNALWSSDGTIAVRGRMAEKPIAALSDGHMQQLAGLAHDIERGLDQWVRLTDAVPNDVAGIALAGGKVTKNHILFTNAERSDVIILQDFYAKRMRQEAAGGEVVLAYPSSLDERGILAIVKDGKVQAMVRPAWFEGDSKPEIIAKLAGSLNGKAPKPERSAIGKKTAAASTAAEAELADAMAELKTALREAGIGANPMLNPKLMVPVGKVTAKLLKVGVTKFADAMVKLTEALGEQAATAARPYMVKAWNTLRQQAAYSHLDEAKEDSTLTSEGESNEQTKQQPTTEPDAEGSSGPEPADAGGAGLPGPGVRGGGEESGGLGSGGAVGAGGRGSRNDGVLRGGRESRKPGSKAPRSDYQPAKTPDHQIDPRAIGQGGAKTKFKNNLEAIKLLKQLRSEGRQATPEEQGVLSLYTGWGALAQAFDQRNREWKTEFEELKAHLSEEEYRSAKESTINAHYTAPQIVQSMWDMVRRMGFTGGRVIETSAGIGNFIGLQPGDLKGNSAWSAVEMDQTTGGMLGHLYPSANTQIAPFQKTPFPDNYFDLAISNVPFSGDIRITSDRRFAHLKPSLHDYFFLKGVEIIRPGGLAVFITSTGTMDKQNAAIREAIADKADLVSAIRLPGKTFMQNAGTEVVTDIIVLRKRHPHEIRSEATEAWLEIGAVADPAGGKDIRLNKYFVENPGQVLGTVDRSGTMYRGGSMNVTRTENFEDLLKGAIERLPQGVMTQGQSDTPAAILSAHEVKGVEHEVRGGQLVVTNNTLYRVGKQGELVPAKAKDSKTLEAKRDMVRDLVPVRTALQGVIRAQMESRPEAARQAARQALSEAYDTFVKKVGPINGQKVRRALSEDVDFPLLSAMEVWDLKKRTATKGDIFTRDTIRPAAKVVPESVLEAIAVSLDQAGRLNTAEMAKMLGKEQAEVEGELVAKGLAFNDPAQGWVAADEYLSGNVRKKLSDAKAAQKAEGGGYDAQIEALEGVIPADIPSSDIHAHIGTPWIPGSTMAEFVAHVVREKNVVAQAEYVTAAGSWVFRWTNTGVAGSVIAREHFGIPSHNLTLIDLMSYAADSKIPKLWVKHKDGTRSVDDKASEELAQKIGELQETFSDWLFADPHRRESLSRIYNDTFNSSVRRHYDGEHLTFPGMLPIGEKLADGKVFHGLRPHQKAAVWQAVVRGRALYAHEVGTGKTMTMTAAAMELRRLGRARKPAMVVPNSRVEATVEEIRELYPMARVLAAAKGMGAKQRAETVAQIATGDWDIVVLTHENLGLVPVSDEVQKAYLDKVEGELLSLLEAEGVNDTSTNGLKKASRGNQTVKRLTQILLKMRAKVEGITAKKDSGGVTFEQTGIDALFVDEAHEFKAVAVRTNKGAVKGIPSNVSTRATNLDMIATFLQQSQNGRGIFLATGTPITNTMAELYIMQRFVQGQELDAAGISTFDAWADTFGEVESKLELNHSGGYAEVSRFRKFANLAELRRMTDQDIDIVRVEDRPELAKTLNRPERIDREVIVPASDRQAEYLQEIASRVRALKGAPPGGPGSDNHLKIATDGQKAALDMRLIDPEAREANAKVNLCAKEILELYRADPSTTQMVFFEAGRSTNTGFDVGAELIALLAREGISRDKILDFRGVPTNKKQKMIARLKAGDAVVAIGNTKTLGTGVNAQDHIVAIHHLEPKWTPEAIEQRNGRGWRQGNRNKQIHIITYISERTLDAWKWQTVANKANFTGQFMSDRASEMREVEEVDSENLEALGYERIMAIASGDPLSFEKINLTDQIKKLQRAEARHTKMQRDAENSEMVLDVRLPSYKARVLSLNKDLDHYNAVRGEPFEYVGPDGTVYDDRVKAGLALAKAYLGGGAVANGYQAANLGTYRGFKLNADGQFGLLTRAGSTQWNTAALLRDDPHNAFNSMESNLRGMIGSLINAEATVTTVVKNLAILREDISRPFRHADKLRNAQRRLEEVDRLMAAKAAKDKDKAPAKSKRLDKPHKHYKWDELGLGGQGTGNASADRYQSPDALGAPVTAQHNLVRIAQALIGKIPEVVKRIRIHGGAARGVFRGGLNPKIQIRADLAIGPVIREGFVKQKNLETAREEILAEIMQDHPELTAADITIKTDRGRKPGDVLLAFYRKDPDYAAKTIAHEIGHAKDWIPDGDMSRGNILGRVASLHRYLNHMIEEAPGKDPLPGQIGGAWKHWLTTLEGEKGWAKVRRDLHKQAREAASETFETGTDEWRGMAKNEYHKLKAEWQKETGFITLETIREELIALSKFWRPFDRKADAGYTRYRDSGKELYADFVSVLLNNPELAAGMAPEFTSAIFAYMKRKPEFQAIYDEIQSDMISGEDLKKLDEALTESFAEGGKKMGEMRLRDESFTYKAKAFVKVIATAFVSRNAAMRGIFRKDLAAGKVKAEHDPHMKFEEAAGEMSEVELYLRRNGQVWHQAAKLGVDYTTWGKFLLHNRVIEERSEMFNPLGLTVKTSQKLLDEIKARVGEKAYTAMEEAQQAFMAERRWLIDRVKRSGMFSQELIDLMNSKDYYSKFTVHEYLEKKHGGDFGSKIFRQYGTLKGVVHPMEATLWQDVSLLYAAAWNEAKTAQIKYLQAMHPELLKSAEADRRWVNDHHEYRDQAPDGYKLLQWAENGKPKGVYVPSQVAEAFEQDRNETDNTILAFGHAIGGLSRQLFTSLNIGFHVMNPMRDVSRAVQSLPEASYRSFLPAMLAGLRVVLDNEFGITIGNPPVEGMTSKALVEYLKETKAILADENIYSTMHEEGLMTREMSRSMGLQDKKSGRLMRTAKIVTAPIRIVFGGIETVGRILERTPKVAGEIYLRNKFPDMPPELRAALVRRYAGSPNFMERGTRTHLISPILLFANPQIQAYDSAAALFRNPNSRPEQVLKMVKYVAVPRAVQYGIWSGLLLAAAKGLFGDDDEVTKSIAWVTDLYSGIPERMARNFWIIPLGKDEKGKTEYLTAAPDQTLQFVGGMMWELFKALPGESRGKADPWRALLQSMSHMGGEVPSLHPIFWAIKDTYNYAQNKNPWDGYADRPAIRQNLFDADTMQTDMAFFKYLWNNLGGGAIQRFPSSYAYEKERGSLEKFLSLPGISNTLGKVIRVSDYGEREEEQRVKEAKRREDAKNREERRRADGSLIKKPRKKRAQSLFR